MISNYNIKNFKTLKGNEFTFGSITLLSGVNGVGKSTLIQSLLLLRQSYLDNKLQTKLKLNDCDGVSLGLSDDLFSIDADTEKDQLEFNIRWNDTTVLNISSNFKTDEMTLDIDNSIDSSSIEQKALFGKNFQYLSANRINPETKYLVNTEYVRSRNFLGKTGEFTVHYLAENADKIIANSELIHSNAKSDTLIDNVSAWLSNLGSSIKVSASYHRDIEVANLNYEIFQGDDFTKKFKPINVGFGLTYVLPVITALLMTPKGGLVIIENPESHLHPKGQVQIGKLCAIAANAGVQLIIESHSDHVLNGIRVAVKEGLIPSEEAQIYYFDRDEDDLEHRSNPISLYIDPNGGVDEWPKGFFDEWDNQLDKLLS